MADSNVSSAPPVKVGAPSVPASATANQNIVPQNQVEVISKKLLELYATIFTKEYMESNEDVRSHLVSQCTIPLERFYELPVVMKVCTDRKLIQSTLGVCPHAVVYGGTVRAAVKSEQHIVILRDVASGVTEQKIRQVFVPLPAGFSEGDATGTTRADCPQPTHCRADVGDNWFVSFSTEGEARLALDCIKSSRLDGAPVKGRLKTATLAKSYFSPRGRNGGSAPLSRQGSGTQEEGGMPVPVITPPQPGVMPGGQMDPGMAAVQGGSPTNFRHPRGSPGNQMPRQYFPGAPVAMQMGGMPPGVMPSAQFMPGQQPGNYFMPMQHQPQMALPPNMRGNANYGPQFAAYPPGGGMMMPGLMMQQMPPGGASAELQPGMAPAPGQTVPVMGGMNMQMMGLMPPQGSAPSPQQGGRRYPGHNQATHHRAGYGGLQGQGPRGTPGGHRGGQGRSGHHQQGYNDSSAGEGQSNNGPRGTQVTAEGMTGEAQTRGQNAGDSSGRPAGGKGKQSGAGRGKMSGQGRGGEKELEGRRGGKDEKDRGASKRSPKPNKPRDKEKDRHERAGYSLESDFPSLGMEGATNREAVEAGPGGSGGGYAAALMQKQTRAVAEASAPLQTEDPPHASSPVAAVADGGAVTVNDVAAAVAEATVTSPSAPWTEDDIEFGDGLRPGNSPKTECDAIAKTEARDAVDLVGEPVVSAGTPEAAVTTSDAVDHATVADSAPQPAVEESGPSNGQKRSFLDVARMKK